MPVRCTLMTLVLGGLLQGGFLQGLVGTILAQEPKRVTLNAIGETSVMVPAERLRVAIPLFAHALSSEDAIDVLRQRKTAAQERAIALGGIADSIRFGGIAIETNDPLRRGNFPVMPAGNDVEIDDLPTISTARADMVVDWKVPAADEEAVVSFAEMIVAELKNPDLTGKDERPEFSPRVEEYLKELQTQNMMYNQSGNRQDLQEIRYLFVATITPALIKGAVQGAFRDAQTKIDSMAQAGNIQNLSMNSLNTSSTRHVVTNYGPMGQRTRKDLLVPRDNEVASMVAGEIQFSAQVQMNYTGTIELPAAP